jgi:hypothetical protein
METLAGVDAIINTDSAHRLPSIWGRRSHRNGIAIDADPSLWARVSAVRWGATG